MVKSILLISGVRGDTRRYRQLHLWQQLRQLGYEANIAHIIDPGTITKVSQASLVIFHRTPLDRTVEEILHFAQQNSIPVLSDYDDYLFDPAAINYIDSPDFADPDRRALYLEDIQRHRQTITSTNGVLASTSFLAEEISKLGSQCYIHRNAASIELMALSDEAYYSRRQDKREITIGYASGTPTHNRDFALIAPALAEILGRYPKVRLCIIGPVMVPMELQPFSNRIIIQGLVPWRQLPSILAGWDINLCPLVLNNPFGKSKSEIKYLEAALVGTVSIASPAPAYRETISHGETGFLADNQEDWLIALRDLIENPSLRRSIAEKAHEDVIRRYSPQARASELAITLDRVCQGSSHTRTWNLGNPDSSSSVKEYWDPAIEKTPTLMRMGLYSLRVNGVLSSLRKGKVYLRRFFSRWFPYRQASAFD